MNKPTSAADYKLSSSFEEVRHKLNDEQYQDRLAKPLAYWALPNDRRLPLAFLGRTLGDLLSTPFDELCATPGIGQKKISSLVKLLHRATKDENHEVPFGLSDIEDDKNEAVGIDKAEENSFDPTVVSEALWAKWRDGVRAHDLGHERLGRLAPSLQSIPTVIWHAPLSQYLDVSIADMRGMRTHGEKRVRCVLEVFHTIHQQIANAPVDSSFAIRLTPKFTVPIEKWIYECDSNEFEPTYESVLDQLTTPLLNQLKTDAAPTVYELVAKRLGIHGPSVSVRQLADELSVTRARVYQLLEDCKRILNVRWPEGQKQLEMLAMQFKSEGWNDSPAMRLFYATCDLFVFDKHFATHDHDERVIEMVPQPSSDEYHTASV